MKYLFAVLLTFFVSALFAQISININIPQIDPYSKVDTQNGFDTGLGTFTSPSKYLKDTLFLVSPGIPPYLFMLSRISTEPETPETPTKYMMFFKKKKTARFVSEISGYVVLAFGSYLLGKAEYYSRYHGTTSDFDTYHITRTSGLVTTGFGCSLIGSGMALDDKLEWWEICIKTFGCLLGGLAISESTYNGMVPK